VALPPSNHDPEAQPAPARPIALVDPRPPAQPEGVSAAPTLRQQVLLYRRHTLVVLLAFLSATGLAYLVTQIQSPTYEASMGLVVGQGVTDAAEPALTPLELTQTATSLLRSDVVAQTVIARQDLDMTIQRLERRMRVTVQPPSAVVEVRLHWKDRLEGSRILAEYARVFGELLRRLQQEGNGPATRLFVNVFDPPKVAAEPVAPRTARIIGVAGVLGLAIGFILAFLRQRLDDRIRTRHDAEDAYGAPVVAALPAGWTAGPKQTPPPWRSSRHRRQAARQALQMLTVNVENASGAPGETERGTTVVVTSAHDGDGKTTLVSHLARSLAEAGRDVVCLEIEASEPRLHTSLGLDEAPDPGVLQVLDGTAHLFDVLHPVHVDGVEGARSGRVWLVPLGGDRDRAPAELGADQLARLIRRLQADSDYVLVDASTATAPTTARAARLAREVILVSRRGRATRARADAVRWALQSVGASRVSVVLTDAYLHDVYT